ncbi:dTDP-4-dehydrorhamnose reductase [Butyrivibrio sp. WCD2001]|uniref:dTDP-4-dehydrorhamnose reductase n=1 Tax=Butyrivibrio sp. WCD2001 TaxID=1280681 RepID=UPI00041E2050|nr:dTDP-4-dehydrorhamnose reductase [Butyrivibrio sp. WCD2001]
MRKVLVTGCNGQLGRAIRQVYDKEVEFILTDVVEGEEITSLNIMELEEVISFAMEKKPDVIINCAAATNVDGCEKDWDFAYKLNALGPRNLAIAASMVDAKLVHISTDYVFPGNASKPITEFDIPAPISAYGKTKYEGEKFVQQFASKWFIVRTAWLYGDGKNFVKTMINLSQNHDELSVVCDQFGSPTSALELARMIHHIEPTSNYGIFHGTCEGDTNWADFTEEIFRLKGIDVKVNHVTSEEYKAMNPNSADRPHYSILDNYMLRLTTDYTMANWHDALKEYLSTFKG